MKADAITSRILDDARKEASETLKDAGSRVEKIRRDNETKIAAQRETAMEKAKVDAAEMRDRMLRMAELDERKELLAMKRRVIGQAFDQALEKMRKMPIDQAQAFVSGLLLANAEGNEELIVSKEDAAIYTAKFLEGVNAALVKAGKRGALVLAKETRDLGGGVVMRRGGMEVNLTYAAVMGEIRPSLEADIAAMLFE